MLSSNEAISLQTDNFNESSDGQSIHCFTLKNKKGASFSVLNYGATVQSLKIPVKNEIRDVVLGFDSFKKYVDSFTLPSKPYFGSIVGRFAGRINEGKFQLDGKTIQLAQNLGEHHLHGGDFGFSNKIWEVVSINTNENPSITLKYVSEDLEENYPGKLHIEITYKLTETNSFNVNIKATTTKKTILNLTNHSYFNLDGHSKDVTMHGLVLNTEKSLETDKDLIPTGKFRDLDKNPFQFMDNKKMPSAIDTTIVCIPNQKVAALISSDSKLSMTVQTTLPGVHIYIGGNCFDEIKGKNDETYHSKSGICFETQNFPDAPNHPNFPNCYLNPNEKYEHETIFTFQ
uniref:aldose epimerase family protein n=1 Tax=Flavobacterium sp. TaxID=239 RepID=UPI00404AFC0D